MRFFVILIGILMTCSMSAIGDTLGCEKQTHYKIGVGAYDITGPAAEQVMMGYATPSQVTNGIYQRIWARAFIIESPCNGKRIVFVNADLGQLFQGIKENVIEKLQVIYGDTYHHQNILITATHQHSGPGGYALHALYNFSTLGFNRKNFDVIVQGITEAIKMADLNMQEANISLASGDLKGVSVNRSPSAYRKNPAVERQRYLDDKDTLMTLLRFDGLDGNPFGTLNWFPVHGTSMSNKNTKITGDNKGYAEYLFEKDFQAENHQPGSFVAAFAQANAGDVSPNIPGSPEIKTRELDAGLKATERSGFLQYEMAKKLFENPQSKIQGSVDFRHTFVKMDNFLVSDTEVTDGEPRMTCSASLGKPLLGGTMDGKGIDLQSDFFKNILSSFVSRSNCQGEKAIVLEVGNKRPYPWVPQTLPLQLLRVGNLAIISVPFEMTTMAGRRLKEVVAEKLKPLGVEYVVQSTLSNAYAGYITTPEEYKEQGYEGASDYFGPWALAALEQEFKVLAKAMVKGEPVPEGQVPENLLNQQRGVFFPLPILFDNTPLGKKFGELVNVQRDVKPAYRAGDTIKVEFWGASPRNDYKTGETFLEVQRLEGDGWKRIRTDNDWDTGYEWRRHEAAISIITITWKTSHNALPGQYRIVHHGNYKKAWDKKVYPYQGITPVFWVSGE